jgi:hypothetical protein
MNKNQGSTKLLIMDNYFVFCVLTFDLKINNRLHILNIHYYKLKFQNFFKFYSEIKFKYLHAQIIFASYITIHLHKYNLHVV